MLENQTPLHMCAKETNTTLAVILLQSGAKIELLNNQNRSFLHLLVLNTSSKVILEMNEN